MIRKSMMPVLALVGASACAVMRQDGRPAPIEVLDVNGVSAPTLSVDSGASLTFVNGDEKPHQVYSPDCPELASTPLQPGDTYTLAFAPGPKVCHFQDLLAPLAGAFSGTVQVERPVHILADDFTGTD
jgi:hypothetical protein